MPSGTALVSKNQKLESGWNHLPPPRENFSNFSYDKIKSRMGAPRFLKSVITMLTAIDEVCGVLLVFIKASV